MTKLTNSNINGIGAIQKNPDLFSAENCQFVECTPKNKCFYDKCMWVRNRVFQEEQGFDIAEELENEDDCAHFLMVVDGLEAATGRYRLMEDGYKLERIAVIPIMRGQGVGSLLVSHLIKSIMKHRTERQGTEKIVGHAQVQA